MWYAATITAKASNTKGKYRINLEYEFFIATSNLSLLNVKWQTPKVIIYIEYTNYPCDNS